MDEETDPTGRDFHEPGAKADEGKVFASLLLDFALALTEVAKVGTYGATKYSRGGWQHVPDGITRYADAEMRHLLASRHEERDKDSGLRHEAQKLWNGIARLELKLREEMGILSSPSPASSPASPTTRRARNEAREN